MKTKTLTAEQLPTMKTAPLSAELLHQMDVYWRAANYLSDGQIYLFGNPLLKQPLKLEHIKPCLLGGLPHNLGKAQRNQLKESFFNRLLGAKLFEQTT